MVERHRHGLVLGRLSVSFFSKFPRLFHQRPCTHTQRLGCGRSLCPRSSAARSAGSSVALLRASQRFGPRGARKWSLPPDACEARTQSNRDCGRGPQLYLECHTPRPSAVEPSGPKPSVALRHREGGLPSFAGLHTFAMCFFAHICAREACVAARELFRRPRCAGGTWSSPDGAKGLRLP